MNVARRRAAEAAQSSGQGGGFFADQFENPANFNAHYEASCEAELRCSPAILLWSSPVLLSASN